MKVLKFGGSSVANADNINKVAAIIGEASSADSIVVVVSAMGGITDLLITCGTLASKGDEQYKVKLQEIENRHLEASKALIPVAIQSSLLSWVKKRCNELEDICNGVFLLGELSIMTKDRIVSYGELISSKLLSSRLDVLGHKNTWKDSRELIRTDSQFTQAAVNFPLTNQQVSDYFASAEEKITIVPGFVAADKAGAITTLGRGGSDYTAAILAAALDASVLEIWTDVSGMRTADPRLVPTTRVIEHISYQEAMELSHFGAKVIYPPTIQPVMNKRIPVWIKNTFMPGDHGTLIENSSTPKGGGIRGISSINRISLLSLEGSGMVGIPGFSKRLFEALSGNRINVILITQASSEHSICVGVDQDNAEKAKEHIDEAFRVEIGNGYVQPLIVEKDLSVIAVVGDNMKSHPGVSGKMFGAMGRNGVNVRAIAQGSSERNITAVISREDVQKAINVLHEEFFETTYKQVHLFIAGLGNVGSKLVAQLKQQLAYLQQNLRLQIRVVGMANSRKMFFLDEGMDLNSWEDQLEHGSAMNLDHFIQTIRTKNLRNTVFADVTANAEVAMTYESLLEKSISVVACNKVACSSPYTYYRRLKNLSAEFNALFLFETNVGAGLPV
ncbi:MAG: bifunctional aspartate kinase/homoserine dehydrogenase I, partial [Chitinophagaceae bacterium]